MPVRRHPIAAASANLPLDHDLIRRLKSTFALVVASDSKFAEIFYDRLFQAAPHLRAMFHSDPKAQAQKLTASLETVVHSLADPARNQRYLAELGQRHAGYGARPEHYQLVIDLLIGAMRDALGPHADPRRLEEWRTALRLVADQMIGASQPDRCAGEAPSAPARR